VAALKPSATVQAKCEKARKLLKSAANEKKQADELEKKADARREEERIEREKLKRMAPAEQAKYEEKQRKKELKKQKGKLMKITKA
jgi:hypothetical protein